ncbi:hypothetical protein XENOCAPTIV_024326 [Xenoophorus captivus]|uniref:Secreted protein n=1 Tax=Xenoophorus captivus TaxID=1517983 RepID=A0ABV0RWV9_9TELE
MKLYYSNKCMVTWQVFIATVFSSCFSFNHDRNSAWCQTSHGVIKSENGGFHSMYATYCFLVGKENTFRISGAFKKARGVRHIRKYLKENYLLKHGETCLQSVLAWRERERERARRKAGSRTAKLLWIIPPVS